MELAKLIAEIEKQRDIIGKARDTLRDLVSDAEVLAESVEIAEFDLDGAINSLKSALEEISQYA